MFNTTNEKERVILRVSLDEVCVRIYYRDKTRSCQDGRFIVLDDFSELWDKGFVRFLPYRNFEAYNGALTEQRKASLTNLQVVKQILDFKTF